MVYYVCKIPVVFLNRCVPLYWGLLVAKPEHSLIITISSHLWCLKLNKNGRWIMMLLGCMMCRSLCLPPVDYGRRIVLSAIYKLYWMGFFCVWKTMMSVDIFHMECGIFWLWYIFCLCRSLRFLLFETFGNCFSRVDV